MSDGSTICLNAGSTLRYPANYGKTKRDIYLDGEGYFKVTHQTEKPFTVYTTLATITDLGTEFNVKAYADENVVELTVINGELAVENSETADAFDRTLLKPGQKLSVSASDPVPVVTQLDPDIAEAEASWKERDWRIESVPLQALAIQLERRYNVRITVDDRSKDLRVTGTIRNETLEQALYAIQQSLSLPIRINIDGKNVDIRMD
jgi:ferric-dicitrate binding protein FerR (iron transport regulator)